MIMSSEPSVTDDITTDAQEATSADSPPEVEAVSANPPQPQDSYTKLAMRNMVRKPRRSIIEFGLTTIGLLALLIGLSYLTR